MTDNVNIDRLNQISSAVSERDKKIWENVAYSIAVRKETEKLKNETAHIKTATAERKKENDILRNQLEELSNTLATQKLTLQASDHSVILQKDLKEGVKRDLDDFKKKYNEVLEMYNDELKDYKSLYENASQSHKDLCIEQIRLKKLEFTKMDLDVKIAELQRRQKEFVKIQKQMFQKTIVKFAEFYTLYHKNEKLRLEIEAKKRIEQQLLKEHLQLSEAAKLKKRSQTSKTKSATTCPSYSEKPLENPVPIKDDKLESTRDKLKKFFEEEIFPCSLTSLNSPKKAVNFSQDHSKVKILDVKVMPQMFKPAVVKPNLDLRKKMQNVMETAKKEALQSRSIQIHPTNSQSGSQQKPPSQKRSTQSNSQTVAISTPKVEIPVETPKENVTGSILKPPSQTFGEKNETNVENVSKFFSSKKKTVTFQTETPKEISNFQLFGEESKKAQPGEVAMNVFRNSFFLKNDTFLKPEDKKEFPEARNSGSDTAVSDLTNNASFTMETGPTFSTLGGENSDKSPEFSFDLLNHSTHRDGFGASTAPVTESTPFSFMGSQTKFIHVVNMCTKIVVFFSFLILVQARHRVTQPRPSVVMSAIRLFWGPNNGTVSKFPPIIEYFVQRIQSQNSNYVHEDLSRPPTWEKPIYTLSPSEQLTAYQPLVTESVTKEIHHEDPTTQEYEYEELPDTTEKFFEIITDKVRSGKTAQTSGYYRKLDPIVRVVSH
ncbi:hypothetical protein TcasGA2_TC014799 [Tribolium castaneum]|uniref:Uncharacterized protein n=1 Tax=Tribolium castaneum TaxID=7070 RepID=D6WJS9_TRICA|nr:hypothetical protein TcasGA2_TC014799 [Tribolium castaneum]